MVTTEKVIEARSSLFRQVLVTMSVVYISRLRKHYSPFPGGTPILPYMGYIGMCGIGYGFGGSYDP